MNPKYSPLRFCCSGCRRRSTAANVTGLFQDWAVKVQQASHSGGKRCLLRWYRDAVQPEMASTIESRLSCEASG